MEDMDHLAAFKEYEALKIEERRIAARLKDLQPIIMPFVPEDKQIQGSSGYFYIQKRPKWKYSSEVEKLEETLEEKMEQEKADGTAVPTYSTSLVYKTGIPEE